MSRDAYITIQNRSDEEIVINKSRFIGSAAPCATEAEALAFLQEIRNTYRSAKHYCYAYIIGENRGIMRYSDDGEPGGTAGLPMMDVLKNREIVNCCVVVTRYFGGVLLGTGGLVRAYTQSSQAAVEAAGIVKMELTCVEACELPYAAWDRFRYAAAQLPVRMEEIAYGSEISFSLLVRAYDREMMLEKLQDVSGRKLKSHKVSEDFMAWSMA